MKNTLIVTDLETEIIEVTTALDSSVVTSDDPANTVIVIDEADVLINSVDVGQEVVITPEVERIIEVLTAGEQGPPGRDGGGGGAGVFILDIQAVTGIVGEKEYTPGVVPANATIESCVTDDTQVRVLVGADGASTIYSPTVTVNGVQVALTETTTKRWFTGTIVVALGPGTTLITAECDGGEDTAIVTRAGAGPDVVDVVFGAYPGTQTALKAGDQLPVTVTTDMDAVSVTLTGPATSLTLPVVAGVASGTLVIGTGSGLLTFTAIANNDLGTPGAPFISDAVLLDQIYPTFGAFIVDYPSDHLALNTGDNALVTCVVSNASSVLYSGAGLVVDEPAVYAATKLVGHSLIGYHQPVYQITATRAANGAQASTSTTLSVATLAPTASISITPSGRLTSSPAGNDYTVRISPNYPLLSAPSLNASAGTWQGAWTASGSGWVRTLRITDDTPRGPAIFSALAMIGVSGIPGTAITAGSTYTVGGFSQRTLTYPAFSRVAALGTTVGIAAKLSAQIVGGNVLILQTNNNVVSTGFYPANADGTYNATGAYIGLSDSAFAGANTSGTLQITVAEAA